MAEILYDLLIFNLNLSNFCLFSHKFSFKIKLSSLKLIVISSLRKSFHSLQFKFKFLNLTPELFILKNVILQFLLVLDIQHFLFKLELFPFAFNFHELHLEVIINSFKLSLLLRELLDFYLRLPLPLAFLCRSFHLALTESRKHAFLDLLVLGILLLQVANFKGQQLHLLAQDGSFLFEIVFLLFQLFSQGFYFCTSFIGGSRNSICEGKGLRKTQGVVVALVQGIL